MPIWCPRTGTIPSRRRPFSTSRALRDEQQQAGVDLTIFGNNWIRTPAGKDPFDIVTEFNAFAAETTAQHSDYLLGLACAVPFGGEKFLKETERAVREYGLKGIMINSSVEGEYLDSPNAVPFFELVTDLDVPLFVHPPRVTIGAEKMEIFRLPEMVGRPFDTTLSLSRFILTGGFERFPNLVMICSHVGGALPMLPGRLDFGYELRKDDSFGPWEPDVLPRAPSTYIEQLYYDTVSLHAPAVTCAVETAGADHVLFGSDFPAGADSPGALGRRRAGRAPAGLGQAEDPRRQRGEAAAAGAVGIRAQCTVRAPRTATGGWRGFASERGRGSKMAHVGRPRRRPS